MNKLFISLILFLTFLSACTTLPFNVAICGNEICEAEEDTVCPSDCSAAVAATLSADAVSDTGSDDQQDSSADSQTQDDTLGDSSTTDDTTQDSTQDSGDSDDDDDEDDEEIIYDTQEEVACQHAWDCTDWNPCEENGMQTRTCYYVGTCSVEEGQPDTRQLCTYVAETQEVTAPSISTESCYDNIQNQGERGVDCGGPCTACPTPTPVSEQPTATWPYILLGIGLLLFIVGVIVYHKYQDKIKGFFQTLKMKLGKKPTKPLAPLQAPPKFSNQQQYSMNQQYLRPK